MRIAGAKNRRKMNALTDVYCTTLCWSGGWEQYKFSPTSPPGKNLTRKSSDGGLGEEGEDTTHETWAGEGGGGDGTQDLLHKEQQVGLQGGREAGIHLTHTLW